MNRRTFLSRCATGLAAAALATHLTFGKLVPVLEPVVEAGPMDYYLIEWPVGDGWTAISKGAMMKLQFTNLSRHIPFEHCDVVKITQPLGSAEARHEIYDKLVKADIPDKYRLPDLKPLIADNGTTAVWRPLEHPRTRHARFFGERPYPL